VIGEKDRTIPVRQLEADLSAVRHALFESNARFETLADALPHMVWSTLPDGSHDYYNARWYEFTGVAEGSTDGDGWNEMFHPDDRERAWTAWRSSLASGRPYEIEYRLRHRSGEYRWTLGRALPMRGPDGRILRWIGTCTDIHGQAPGGAGRDTEPGAEPPHQEHLRGGGRADRPVRPKRSLAEGLRPKVAGACECARPGP